METRRCPKCGEEKPTSQFYAAINRPGGYYQYCRQCNGAAANAWYKANKDGQRHVRLEEAGYRPPTEKPCRVCGIVRPATREFFHPRREAKDGLTNECKDCRAHWRAQNRVRLADKTRRYTQELRYKMLSHYSQAIIPFCACCGETTYEFLALDHIAGQGGKERKDSGKRLAAKLQARGWPPGYQVLCHNCNMGKSLCGECPHQREWRRLIASGAENL